MLGRRANRPEDREEFHSRRRKIRDKVSFPTVIRRHHPSPAKSTRQKFTLDKPAAAARYRRPHEKDEAPLKHSKTRRRIVLMGVAGSGKSVVGVALAARIGTH